MVEYKDISVDFLNNKLDVVYDESKKRFISSVK